MPPVNKIDDALSVVVRAQSILSIASDDLMTASAERIHLLARIANAEPIIDAVYTILTEEHPELADMLYEGLQALRGRQAAPVERERAA